MSLTAPSPAASPFALPLALLVGAAGGWLGYLISLPLAWMIGAMVATTAAALAGLPVRMPGGLRSSMIAVLGVMLGSGFSPALLDHLGDWTVTLSALLPYVALAGLAARFYFVRCVGYDRVTAFFAGMPGGLTEMVLIGGAMGGNERVIALSHASRVLIVVMIIPFAFRWIYPEVVMTGTAGAAALADLGLRDAAILVVTGLVGYGAARLLRLPAAAIIGPMVASAVVHLAGWTAARPPVELSSAAQVVMGVGIGCRFAGAAKSEVWLAARNALGGTVMILSVSIAFALLLQQLTGLPLPALVLAFSPGGLAEMSLIALALEIDPAYVATHHLVRIFLIILIAPLTFRLWFGGKRPSSPLSARGGTPESPPESPREPPVT